MPKTTTNQPGPMDAFDAAMASANKRDDAPNGLTNHILRIAYGYSRFATAIVRDNMHASQNGLPVKNAYSDPNGREVSRSGGATPVKTYVTDATVDGIDSAMHAIIGMAKLAGRLAHTDHEGEIARIEDAAMRHLANVRRIDRDLWAVYCDQGKQHLPGLDAAIAEIDGRKWGMRADGTLKGAVDGGFSARIRDDRSADRYIGASRSRQSGGISGGYLSERDLIG